MMMQVWINLLDNAIKFSKDNSEIVVEIEKKEDRLHAKITNFGITIDEEQSKKVFNKFYKGDGAKDGNGIGLSIVKHIVELHFGRVELLSNDNKTTFTVILPL